MQNSSFLIIILNVLYLEAYNILSTKNYGLCGLYVALSVVGCIAGVWCGKKLANLV